MRLHWSVILSCLRQYLPRLAGMFWFLNFETVASSWSCSSWTSSLSCILLSIHHCGSRYLLFSFLIYISSVPSTSNHFFYNWCQQRSSFTILVKIKGHGDQVSHLLWRCLSYFWSVPLCINNVVKPSSHLICVDRDMIQWNSKRLRHNLADPAGATSA